jgi:hypothetical protein
VTLPCSGTVASPTLLVDLHHLVLGQRDLSTLSTSSPPRVLAVAGQALDVDDDYVPRSDTVHAANPSPRSRRLTNSRCPIIK